MPPKPEAQARETIDRFLEAAGWAVQDFRQANLSATSGVAIREFPMKRGHGHADYLLFVHGQAVGVVEAKPVGTTLIGVEVQSEKYGVGFPENFQAARKPLPFRYESTGAETRFTNGLDPDPRSRRIFNFHTPEALAAWLRIGGASTTLRAAEARAGYGSTLRGSLQTMPPLIEAGLRTAQIKAIKNLEKSLASDQPRSLVQMATGSGKTIMAIAAIYRLIKFGGAQRVLFLVDRANLGRQALKEFQQYTTPDDGRKFTELYNVQRLSSNSIDPAARVVITTIQRLYSMLRGDEELDSEIDEASPWETVSLLKAPAPLDYNPKFPVETFDIVFTDECHRSIYNLWRQVIEYFDAFLIGLTATPSKQTLGFFNQNLVMEYNHEQAVADGDNVDFEVYRIRTQITQGGSKVEKGFYVDKRDRLTRAIRWHELEDDLTYGSAALDRDVVALDQIRTIIEAFRDNLHEILPGRTEVPKTLIYAKDDSHAEDIVEIVREVFGKGNEFAEKITYRTNTSRVVTKKRLADGSEVEVVTYKSGTGVSAEDLLQSFRNSYSPRIAVTVDMIATGTDIKPLEIVMFMRDVKSRNFFEQMKGRGVRTIGTTDLQAVTPDASSKTHFVLVDAVGVTDHELQDTVPLEKQPTVSFDKLLQAVAFNNNDPEILSSLASRLTRLDHQISDAERHALTELAGGSSIRSIAGAIIEALDPDRHIELARVQAGMSDAEDPNPEQISAAAQTLLRDAAAPLATNPALRNRLMEARRLAEQSIDTISADVLLEAGHSAEAREKQQELVRNFEEYIRENRDELTALQVIYNRAYKDRLREPDVRELAEALAAPPRAWTGDRLWQAYEALDKSKVRGSARHALTDIVALVRYALEQDEALIPFPETVERRYEAWLGAQQAAGRDFTAEQRWWLESIKDAIASSFAVEMATLEYPPFAQKGGLGKADKVFGDSLGLLLDELNRELVA